MFEICLEDLFFDADLQIIQAEIQLTINQQEVFHEILCLDVGLPSMVRSVFHELQPNRWAKIADWHELPFFVCGCGDPECKAYSFAVHHLSTAQIELTELEEQEQGEARILQKWRIPLKEYAREIVKIAEQFLDYTKPLDYHPLFPQTVTVIQTYVSKIKQEILQN
jgi:hypothetical protein